MANDKRQEAGQAAGGSVTGGQAGSQATTPRGPGPVQSPDPSLEFDPEPGQIRQPAGPGGGDRDIRKGDMVYRKLGTTGELVSILGLGGSHLGDIESDDECVAVIRRAVDGGITFLDNCWDYNEGRSETLMGRALKDGYRDKVFLMTKIDGRDKKTAAAQIDESLGRLGTDRVDLMQFHEVIRLEDPDRIFAQGGAIEAMMEAQQAGKVRFIGFTGHKDPLVHLRMLGVANAHAFRFDAVQMPLNVMDASFRSFEEQVVPALKKLGIGVIGMKPLGNPHILDSKTVSAVDCLHYAMSLLTDVVITGVDSQAILDQAFLAVKTYRQLEHGEMRSFREKARQHALTGKFELYKTTARFDGTVRSPDWLGPSK